MKRVLGLALALFCVVGLTACGPKVADAIAADTLYNSKTKQSVSLLMTKQAVEALLGAGTTLTLDSEEFAAAFPGIEFVGYGEGANFIAVSYKEGVVQELSNYSAYAAAAPVASNWKMKAGIGYGTSKKTIEKEFGETMVTELVTDPALADEDKLVIETPGIEWKTPVAMLYFFNADGLRQEGGLDKDTKVQMRLFMDEAGAGLLLYSIAVQAKD